MDKRQKNWQEEAGEESRDVLVGFCFLLVKPESAWALSL